MQVLHKIESGIGVVNKINNLLLGIDLVVMFLVLMAQVFSRFIIFVPMSWSQDLITFLLVVSCFLGAGSATAYGKQIRLEFFTNILPIRFKDLILIIADIISIIFLAIVIQQSAELGIENLNTKIGASLVPSGYYYFAVTYGSIVMILNFFCLIVNRIREIKEKRKEGKA